MECEVLPAADFLCGCQNPVDKYIQYVKINHVKSIKYDVDEEY